ncbi:SDR family NAD(P)-dependent oxidoreductase, partial [Brucella pseudogrignonensis]
MSRFEGTTAVVTGAARGLGAALAFSLAEAGCNVVLCGRSLKALEETADKITKHTGRGVDTVQVDLADMA